MRDPFSNECIVDCFDLDRGNAGLSGEIIFFDDAFTDQIKGSPRIKNDLLFNREKCSIVTLCAFLDLCEHLTLRWPASPQ